MAQQADAGRAHHLRGCGGFQRGAAPGAWFRCDRIACMREQTVDALATSDSNRWPPTSSSSCTRFGARQSAPWRVFWWPPPVRCALLLPDHKMAYALSPAAPMQWRDMLRLWVSWLHPHSRTAAVWDPSCVRSLLSFVCCSPLHAAALLASSWLSLHLPAAPGRSSLWTTSATRPHWTKSRTRTASRSRRV